MKRMFRIIAVMISLVAASCTKNDYTPQSVQSESSVFFVTLSQKGIQQKGETSIITLKIINNQTNGSSYLFDYELDGQGILTKLDGKDEEVLTAIPHIISGDIHKFAFTPSVNGMMLLKVTLANGKEERTTILKLNVGQS